MIKIKHSIYILAIFALSAVNGYSQKESIILYNSQPVKVELSEKGNIKSFIGLVPGYMVGFDLTPTESVKTLAVEEKSEATDNGQNAGYAIVSTETIELQYQPNFATLDKALINKLNEVSARLRLNPKLKILITAHAVSQNKSKLTTNRLASAIAYLGLKGISPERIKTETQESLNFVDIVVINYLN